MESVSHINGTLDLKFGVIWRGLKNPPFLSLDFEENCEWVWKSDNFGVGLKDKIIGRCSPR